MIDGVRPRGGAHFPELGEHTDVWLDELGIPRGRGVGRRFSWKRLLRRLVERGL
jgi:hypothetical protein